MKKLLIGVAVVASAFSGSAEAATIVQSGPTVASVTTPFPLHLFDSNLGTLNSVSFGQTFDVSALIQLTNTSSTSQSSAFNFVAGTNLVDPQSSAVSGALRAIDSATYIKSVPYSLAPGQTGSYVINSGPFSSAMSSGVPSILNALSAPGGGMFVGQSNLYGFVGGISTNIASNSTVVGTGTFSLAYNYTPAVSGAVPEPATWAMMILGMGAVGFAMRSAKRRSDEKFDAKIKRMTYGIA